MMWLACLAAIVAAGATKALLDRADREVCEFPNLTDSEEDA